MYQNFDRYRCQKKWTNNSTEGFKIEIIMIKFLVFKYVSIKKTIEKTLKAKTNSENEMILECESRIV